MSVGSWGVEGTSTYVVPACLLVFVLFFGRVFASEAAGGLKKPRGAIRVLYHADNHPLDQTPFDVKPEHLHHYVDNLSDGGVDAFSLMAFVSGQTLWQSDHAIGLFRKMKRSDFYPKLARLWRMGAEPLDVYARRCHEKGMKFLAKFRMNDNHSRGELEGPLNAYMGTFIEDHQEWWLKTYPGGLDYTHQGVRDWIFELAHEVTSRFDVDGLTFAYIRYPYVFEPDEAWERREILTTFMRRVRGMLDEEGARKGRKLLFCVIVPQTLRECRNLGLDVPTWIGEGIIDIVCPSDYASPDFDAPYEEFAELTRPSECVLLPAVHPYPSRPMYKRVLMSPASYRGLVRNFYAEGADGLSAFNFMYHWAGVNGMAYPGRPEMYPAALSYFKELRDPQALEAMDRHYISIPLGKTSFQGLLDRSSKYVLERGPTPVSGAWEFRAAEDYRGGKALVVCSVLGLLLADEIEMAFNGEVVPPEEVERVYFENGRTREQEGAKLPAYTSLAFVPGTPAGTHGENTLAITLKRSAPGAQGGIEVREIEVAVSVTSADPRRIMDMIHERKLPPLPVVAGYHPHYSSVWTERTRSANFGEEPQEGGQRENWKVAQRFVLEEKSLVKLIDVFVYPRHPTRDTVLLSVQTDSDGRPSGRPAVTEARAKFNPLTRRFDPRDVEGTLNLQCQGYYTFPFEEPLTLAPGAYWAVVELESARERCEDPADIRQYRVPLTSGRYPEGRALRWRPAEGWTSIGETMFFGVHGEHVGR